jgi:hypothetical protein
VVHQGQRLALGLEAGNDPTRQSRNQIG